MDDSYFGTGTTNYTNYTKEMNDMKGNRDYELHERNE